MLIVKTDKDLEIERLKEKKSDLQIINDLLTRMIVGLDKRNSNIQYIEGEPPIFNNVAEPKSELTEDRNKTTKNEKK